MNTNKAKLSKSILEMKFMKRTKEKIEKEQFQEEGEEYFGNELTKRMKQESERFIIEPSYTFCEKLIEGRVSFQGMNLKIEKLMEEKENDNTLEETSKETDISDAQMTQDWKGYKKKITEHNYKLSKESNNDFEPIVKKPKFLRPQD
ncbi:M-phase phosphoprotein 6 [Osmia bicornis bicornis]|uniref:M-phase phosphoprotein 6 n=1 Tax=Osmia bicornis bicornis TaxID=1437191 RepID=UPI0010F6B136|nr:M-phase phosphoprotein 6 [Osmia bicornis bicornis]